MGRLWQTLILMKAYPLFEYLPFETIISLLYEHGASLRGTIPFWAHRSCSILATNLLLKMGTNINDSYEFESTALHLCIERPSRTNTQVLTKVVVSS